MAASRKKSPSGFASTPEVQKDEEPVIELESFFPESEEPEETQLSPEPEITMEETPPPSIFVEEPKIETPPKPFVPPRRVLRHPRNTPKFSRTL